MAQRPKDHARGYMDAHHGRRFNPPDFRTDAAAAEAYRAGWKARQSEKPTIVYEVHATPDVQRYRAECAKLSGFGATPLDAIRELLDNEDGQRRVDAWRKACGHE